MSIIINSQEYKQIEIIGRGGFGIVYKLEKDNIYYAYKQILIKFLSKEEIDKYLDEAEILSGFNNEYIVKYYYSYIEKDNFTILMEYAGNSNLKQFILHHKKNDQLIEENIVIDLITQICLGLKEIHNKKLIHRDLSPENIFINENKKIKIGDFGVSKRLDTNNQFAFTSTGKQHYNAPEIEKNEKYDYRADIYSLGCIIYELFTLNEFYIDKVLEEKECKINQDYYNVKWQKLIDLLLKKNYKERPNIEEVYKYIIQNKIILTLSISEDDINKKIYFLDNWYQHNHLKEMNESNTEIYIENREKEKFEKFFIPKKEGTYIIKIFLNFIIKDCSYMFYRCSNIRSIDFSSFNSKNVTNMSYMFCECVNLENCNLSCFNNKNVTNLRAMFYNCNNLENINLTKLNTEKVTNMSYMFFGCHTIKNIDLSFFKTAQVTNMSYMFYECNNLESIDLSNFNNINVMDMSNMFGYCYNLKSINLSNFNPPNVAYMSGMFYYCQKLKRINLSSFNAKNIIGMDNMFTHCFNLNSSDLSSFSNILNDTSTLSIFNKCDKLTQYKFTQNFVKNLIKYNPDYKF